MRVRLSFMGVVSFIALAACRSSGAGAGDRGIGEPCRKNSDCIRGAACAFATCDFVAPCRATSTGADGTEETAYVFDARGRELGFTRTLDGRVTMRQVVSWSDDGRTSEVRMYVGGEPEAEPVETRIEHYDAFGDLTHLVETDLDGETSETRFTWSDDWGCRASVIEMTRSNGVSVTRSTCDDDGNPITIRAEKKDRGDLIATREYTYLGGRMATRAMIFPKGERPPLRLATVRDKRGAISGLRHDYDDDGVFETHEVYDLGCWEVSGKEVVYKRP